MKNPENLIYLYSGIIAAIFYAVARTTTCGTVPYWSELYGEFIGVWLLSTLLSRLIFPRVENAKTHAIPVVTLVILIIVLPFLFYLSAQNRLAV
mgnify:CR=1 FL=1